MLMLAGYLLLGVFAGFAAGLLGIGGGAVVVPGLFFLLPVAGVGDAQVMHLAVASSLAAASFTAISSTAAHHARGAVRWPLVQKLSVGIVLGVAMGSVVADRLPGDALRMIFGIFETGVGVQMFFGLKPAPGRDVPGLAGLLAAGVVIGGVSTVMGIAGGTLTVPLLLWCAVPLKQAIATSAACGVPIATIGAIGLGIAGADSAGLPAWATGYVFWPAVLGIAVVSIPMARQGARVAHALPVDRLRRVFALFLVAVGLRMLVAG